MSDTYLIYSLVFAFALVAVVLVIGVRRVCSLTNLSGIYLVVFTATYLVRPLLTELAGDTRELVLLNIAGLERMLVPMCLAVVVALATFALGYKLPLTRPEPSAPSTTQQPKIILGLCVTLIVIGYLSLLLGPLPGIRDSDIVTEQTESGSTYTTTTGYLIEANVYVAAGAVLLYAWSGQLLPSVLLSLPWFIVRLFIGWNRAAFLFFLIALAVVWLIRYRKGMSSRAHLVPIAALLLVAFAAVSVINGDRYFFRQRDWSLDDALNQSTTAWTQSFSPIAGFETTLYYLQLVPDHYPFANGANYWYRYFIQWIPRILWRDKPIPTDLIGWYDPVTYGAAPGALGDAYWNFGWLGIVLFFFGTGLALNWVESRFARSSQSPAVVASYATFYALMIHLGRDSLPFMLATYALYWGIPFMLARVLELRASHKPALHSQLPMPRTRMRAH